jgi:4-hydroxythreonine-4-phosphate dehydrogenase
MKPLLVTMGDPNGVGPEICAKLFLKPPQTRHPLCLVGSRALARKAGVPEGVPVLDGGVEFGEAVRPGVVSAEAGRASIGWVRFATEQALAGEVAAIVTAPVCKAAVAHTVRGFQGHTEFIGGMCGDPEPVLALVSGKWVVAHVSTHVSLREAIERAQVPRILKVSRLLHGLLVRLGVERPRIGVCGLNPHAGEDGLFGREEIEVVLPAVEQLRVLGIDALGPLPGDVAFPKLKAGAVDGVVAMYHDQGHIVTKTLYFDLNTSTLRGVNTTLGLPVVRTSVDHGTGFDIAWQGKAGEGSLVDAVLLADKLAGG